MRDDFIYHNIWIAIVSVLFFIVALLYKKNTYRHKRTFVFLVLWSILYIGLRPITDECIDTVQYAKIYEEINDIGITEDLDPFFMLAMKFFNLIGCSVHIFFLFCAVIYVCSYASLCKWKYYQESVIVFLSVLVSFSFFSYGINAIRNGLSVAFFLFGFIYGQKGRYMPMSCFMILSFYTHSSSLLLIVAYVLSCFYKNVKAYYCAWLVSLLLVLLLGDIWQRYINFLPMLSKHDTDYFLEADDSKTFSMSGFRWDFLLYGIIPILVSYYYIVKRGFKDSFYNRITIIYLVANILWLFMSSNWLSNRFGFLSWWLYIPMIFYPILQVESGRRKERYMKYAFVGNYAFTMLMFFIGKYV